MALFKKSEKPDTETQFVYRLRYYPFAKLGPGTEQRVIWKKTLIFTRALIEESMDESGYFVHSGMRFQLNWIFNNIPTEAEWQATEPGRVIAVQLRIITPYSGREAIALLCPVNPKLVVRDPHAELTHSMINSGDY